jgi:hypothetical protein
VGCRGLQFHADPDAERPARLLLEFERFQVLHESIRELAYDHGVCVRNLFLREECVVFPAVSAIGTMTGGGALDACAQCHLELAKAFLHRAFLAEIAVVVDVQIDIDLATEVLEIIAHVSAAFLVVPDAWLQLFSDGLPNALGNRHDLLADRLAHVFRHQVFFIESLPCPDGPLGRLRDDRP